MTKILIVDDNLQRYQSLVSRLKEEGVARDSIKMLPSSNDALDELKANEYDLLVLDILIPAWPCAEPEVKNSLDLLFAVTNDPEVIKPTSILGITADERAASAALSEFEANTWTVVAYSPVSDGWAERIVNCVKYLREKASNPKRPKYEYDLAVLCALQFPELEQVTRLPWQWSSMRPLDDTTFFQDGHFEIDGKRYKVAAAHAPRVGTVSSAVTATKVIRELRPKVLAMTGICAGHKSKAKLGDVLVADPAWDFQSGKFTNQDGHAKMEFSPHQIPILAALKSRFEQLATDRHLVADIVKEFGSDAPSGFKLRIGPVASGGAVHADGKIIDDVRRLQNRDLLGIEMEIYGVYAAAQLASGPQPKVFAIKGICDYADPDKHDGTQRFAAFASAKIMQEYVNRFALELFRA